MRGEGGYTLLSTVKKAELGNGEDGWIGSITTAGSPFTRQFGELGRQRPHAVRALVGQVRRRRGFSRSQRYAPDPGPGQYDRGFIGCFNPTLWERLNSNHRSGYDCENASKYHSANTKSANVKGGLGRLRHLPICSCVRGSLHGRASAAAAHAGPWAATGTEWHTRLGRRGFLMFSGLLLDFSGSTPPCPCPLLMGPFSTSHITVEAARQARQKLRCRPSARKQASSEPTSMPHSRPGTRLSATAPLFV